MEHLKHHIEYPADRKEVVEHCNNFSDVPKADSDWFSEKLPEGNYNNAEDVVRALLTKV
ncbi:MAG: hypothetical protein ACE5KH_03510 [Candidatus Geothermarchaeales archaeon]